MKHPNAARKKQNIPPSERFSYKQSSSRSVGSEAVRKSIIVSKPDHKIGLIKSQSESPFDVPEDASRMHPESYAATVLSTAEVITDSHPNITGRGLGRKMLESIDEQNDSETIIALKQLAAKIFGLRVNADYQEIITTLDDTMNADDLSDYLLHIYEWSHENEQTSDAHEDDIKTAEDFVKYHMTDLSGFRVEASFTRLAERAGFTLRQATRFEDHHGLDVMVDGVPFDLKSSHKIAKFHASKIKRQEKNPNRIHAVKFVPPITVEDFSGRLVVPYENVERILETTPFVPMVHKAIRHYKDEK